MGLKIKRVLAFAMTLTMLLGCFVFSTSANEAPGTGDIVCSGADSNDGLSFVVREGDINGIADGYTMYYYANGSGDGWARPISDTTKWTAAFDPGFTGAGSLGVADWCKASVTTVIIYSGVVSFANNVFGNYTALKYVGLDMTNCTTLANNAMSARYGIFEGCALNAIYKVGDIPVNGVADLTMMTQLGRDNSGNNDFAFSGVSGIKTIKLGSSIKITAAGTFADMNGLETIEIAAVNADNITFSSWNNSWGAPYLGNAVFECANKEVADTLATKFDSSKVTYAGKTVTTKFAQTSAVEGGKYSVRFAAVGNDTGYQVVGFRVIALNVEGKVWRDYTSTVYNSVTGTNASGTFTETAAEHDGTYIYTITINDIPTSVGEVTFLVRPTYDSNDTTYYGHSETFTVGGVN